MRLSHFENNWPSDIDDWFVLTEQLAECMGIATFVSCEMFVFHAMFADSSESSMIILSDCNFHEIHGNNHCHQTSSMLDWYADSNTMLGLKIQMITLITFLNDEIVVQEYIYGANILYIQTVRTFHTSMMI
jgi:hypothetical protein